MADLEPRLVVATTGAWAGWKRWEGEPFEAVSGPFYSRDEDAETVCAFRVEPKHMNGSGAMHGGALAAFADSAIFGLSEPWWIETGGVTVGLNCQYIGPAFLGDLVEARAKTIQDTPQMVFITAEASVAGRTVMTFTGIIKRKRKKPAAIDTQT